MRFLREHVPTPGSSRRLGAQQPEAGRSGRRSLADLPRAGRQCLREDHVAVVTSGRVFPDDLAHTLGRVRDRPVVLGSPEVDLLAPLTCRRADRGGGPDAGETPL
jgi:hypothetical protein